MKKSIAMTTKIVVATIRVNQVAGIIRGIIKEGMEQNSQLY